MVASPVANVACGDSDSDAGSSTGGMASHAGGQGAGNGGAGRSVMGAGAAGLGGGAGGISTTDSGGASTADSGGHAATGGDATGGVNGTGGSNGTGGDATGGANGTGGNPSVTFPSGMSDAFPLPGARDVCVDTPLRFTFAGAPAVGSAGTVRVFDASSPAQPVATVDFATMTITDTIGGQSFTLQRRVFVDGNDVVVYLKARALAYGRTYFVSVEGGAIRGPGGAAFGITGGTAWTFTTKPSAPSTVAALTVALDGTGDYCSLQGALDAVPANGPARIDIAPGRYDSIVYFSGKKSLTIHGRDRKGVVLTGVNNETLNPGTRTRALVGADNAGNLAIENLTIQNRTPQGGSQAEALRLQSCERCIVRDADITSLQDTLLWSGKVYAKNCFIAGNVDFVWGTGVGYFDACEIKTVGRSGPVVQARNGAGAYGYVFVDSRLTGDAGLTGSFLGRIDAAVYPASQVAYVDCTLGSHISSAGWTVTNSPIASLRLWEYGSKTPTGAAIDVSGRAAGSAQISAAQAATLRDKKTVLGGWDPDAS
jgi:hypothetical protein